MTTGRSNDPVQDLQDRYSDYKVYDEHYEEIGKVDDIFVDENDQPEYIGVKMGFLGMKSTVVPMDLVRVNERRGLIEVAGSKEFIKNGPSFDDDEEISPEHEAEILRYYGRDRASQSRGASYAGSGGGHSSSVDMEYGERSGPSDAPIIRDEEPRAPRQEEPRREESLREEPREQPAARESRSADRDEDEIRVERKEEELRAGVRQREAGSVNVRKRVRTDQEQVRVPKRREEVTVERVPVEESGTSAGGSATSGGETPGVESSEDEIRIPIVEEEVVVEKRPVVKEEIRIRKDLVEEEEVVQADVRKEEVEVDDETRRRER
ncbi:MAG: PRC and DUF2382 domain-containing protein [Rubrobacteraceae bacterium]